MWRCGCECLVMLMLVMSSSSMTFHQGGYNELQVALAPSTAQPANCSQLFQHFEVRKFSKNIFGGEFKKKKREKLVFCFSLRCWMQNYFHLSGFKKKEPHVYKPGHIVMWPPAGHNFPHSPLCVWWSLKKKCQKHLFLFSVFGLLPSLDNSFFLKKKTFAWSN